MKTLYISYFGAMKPLVQTQVVPYLAGLSAEGIDVSLITFEERLTDPAQERVEMQRLTGVMAAAGIHWVPLRYHKRPSLPATIYDVLIGTAVASWLIHRRQIDVVHARNHVPGVMALVVQRLLGVKLLFDMRGVMAEEYVDAGLWKEGSVPFRITKWVERRIFSRADAFVMLTNKIREVLLQRSDDLRRNNAHIEIIPCCADLEKFLHADGSEVRRRLGIVGKRVLVYAGSLGGWYMLDEMLALFQVGRTREEALHLLLLTQSDHAAAYAAVTRAGIPRDAYTVLTVAPDQIPEYLAAANIAVSFIKPCFSKLSSSPTKIGEYLAAGLPIMTNTGIGDVDQLVRDERVGVLVDGFSSQRYEQAWNELQVLLGEDGDAVRERCRSAAERHFSLAEVGRVGYLRVYRQLGWIGTSSNPSRSGAA